MSTEIVVNVGIVHTAADDLDVITTRMRTTLEEMDAALRPLEVDWTGAAAAAYRAAQRAWRTEIGQMVDLLGVLSGVVETSGHTYESTEGDVRSAWG